MWCSLILLRPSILWITPSFWLSYIIMVFVAVFWNGVETILLTVSRELCLVLTILPSLDGLYKLNKVDHKIWIKFLKETNLSVASALFDPWNMLLKNRIVISCCSGREPELVDRTQDSSGNQAFFYFFKCTLEYTVAAKMVFYKEAGQTNWD